VFEYPEKKKSNIDLSFQIITIATFDESPVQTG
jgi:hypothetical protein